MSAAAALPQEEMPFELPLDSYIEANDASMCERAEIFHRRHEAAQHYLETMAEVYLEEVCS